MASLGLIPASSGSANPQTIDPSSVDSEQSKVDTTVSAVYIRVRSETVDDGGFFPMEESDGFQAEASPGVAPLSSYRVDEGVGADWEHVPARAGPISYYGTPRPMTLEDLEAEEAAGGAGVALPAASGGGTSRPVTADSSRDGGGRRGGAAASVVGASISIPRIVAPKSKSALPGIKEKLAILQSRINPSSRRSSYKPRIQPYIAIIEEETRALIQSILGHLEPHSNIGVYSRLDDFFDAVDFEELGPMCIGVEDFLVRVQRELIGILKNLDEHVLKKLHEALFLELSRIPAKGLREIAAMAVAFKKFEAICEKTGQVMVITGDNDALICFGAIHLLNDQFNREAYHLLSLISESTFSESIKNHLYIPLSTEGNLNYRNQLFPSLLKWFSQRKYYVRAGELADIIKRDPKGT